MLLLQIHGNFSSSEMKYLTHTLFLSVKTAFSIYDLTRRKVLERGETTVADLSILKSGIFILEAANGQIVKIEISE